jgi:hypothetical protein
MRMDTKRTLAFLLIVIAAEAFITPTFIPYAARGFNRIDRELGHIEAAGRDPENR